MRRSARSLARSLPRRRRRCSSSAGRTALQAPRSAARPTRSRRPPRAGSASAVADDEIGGDAEQEAPGEQVEAQLAVVVAPHAGPDLADDIEDRTAGERVEPQLERPRVDLVAE